MSTAILTIPDGRGKAFFPMEKDAIRSYTHALPEPPLLSNLMSAIIELSSIAGKNQENEEKTQELITTGN